MRFEILAAVKISIVEFWIVTACVDGYHGVGRVSVHIYTNASPKADNGFKQNFKPQ
jgi:hypothetical protein